MKSSHKISFRRAQHNDRPFLLALRKMSMGEHLENAGLYLTDEQHLMRIDEFFNDSSIIMVNEQDIGLVKLGLNKQGIHIRQLQILPSHHGKGIGSYVLSVVKKQAVKRSLPITLNVLLANPAKNLYLKHGFETVGENQLEFQMKWHNSLL